MISLFLPGYPLEAPIELLAVMIISYVTSAVFDPDGNELSF
jgi:hypothetical protein